MRIWIKASVITFAIAMAILFFQSYWFLDGKDIKRDNLNYSVINEPSPEAESIKMLKDSLFISTFPENYSNFALRLSSTYEGLGKYDSAARYKELVATDFPNEENWISAGLMYFKVFENASGEEESIMARKAIICLENGLSSTSQNNVKLALAKLYIAMEESTKAKNLLHEVLIDDATNKEALYIRGIQLYQLNQFELASEDLIKLVQVDSSNINGLYYLAVCKLKLGNPKEAKLLFEKLKLLGVSEELENNIGEHLNDIK